MKLKSLDGKALGFVKTLIFLAALIPLGKLVVMGLTAGLGANPVEKIARTTGYWTLAFLMITLGVTPARKLSGWQWLARMRRMLGLYAFFYASLHFLTYLVADQFFDWSAIAKDIVERPYITVGFPAFALLIPLAITSADGMVRRLGGKNWRLMHRLVYPIAIGGVAHFWWLVKKDISSPLNFACILVALLGFRLYEPLRRYATNRSAARHTRAP